LVKGIIRKEIGQGVLKEPFWAGAKEGWNQLAGDWLNSKWLGLKRQIPKA